MCETWELAQVRSEPRWHLLSPWAASQRDDGALKRPSHLTCGAAGKVIAKLHAEGHIEVKPRF
jgi:hypothetical protein